ncbi:formate dehydrogenase accessory protein FdhE [Desertibaculum subflavum]|uniref:formate dehydrogenase accessory protein FdhE n=1 Tax=Desertibaculum subflavum TaxID=2268458 RepID=UPI000E66B811
MTVKGSVVSDPTKVPVAPEVFLRLPDRARLHARRAARFAKLAEASPMGDFLRFLGQIATAQGVALAALPAPPSVDAAALGRLHDHGMPVFGRSDHRRGAEWQVALDRILAGLRGGAMPEAARTALDEVAAMSRPDREAFADRVLGERLAAHELAPALFVGAALQVYWIWRAGALDASRLVAMQPDRLCPVCGSAPLCSLIDLRGLPERTRYLHCALCEADWRYIRAKCADCGSVEGLAYHGLEGVESPARAETCDACKGYVKILTGEKDAEIDPFADDLATLGLDLKVSEAGWQRAAANPFLLAG